MCGRFCCACSSEKIADRLGVNVDENQYEITYNAAPTQILGVLASKVPEQLSFMRWGLVPSWAADKSIGAKMINARVETLHEKPSFRHVLRTQRCLVPATGFYEWKASGKKKHPYYIHLKNIELFFFAGLWDSWIDKSGGEILHSFTIITTRANSLMQTMHDRMPVILPAHSERDWLEGDLPHDELKPYESEEMEAYSVSHLVNKVCNNDAGLISRESDLSLF